jgi:hypothetical protein
MISVENFFKSELEIAHLRGGIDQITVIKKLITDLGDDVFSKYTLMSIIEEYEKLCQSELESKIKLTKGE